MKADEVRERYLGFFEARGHARYPSDSLVPENDPSLLFTGAGMNQFKDLFLGRGTLPHRRITTCQKCLRTGDLENVGRTPRHHTFFEMLGNFSFGDYFKAEAIPWCWEFHHRDLGIPAERLWASVYEKDDEAAEIWRTQVGLPAAKIVRLGEADNYWPANAPSQGPNGPCGPCSELYYDFGPEHGCARAGCAPGCDCNRFVEIGNIVFTQFDRREGGVLAPLAQKNIDFGGGLERVAAVVQGVHSNFDTDLLRPILAAEEEVLRARYDPNAPSARRLRRIADHIRAITFLVAEGVSPSNDGRGYVLRKILRTAHRDGAVLGHEDAFLWRLVPAVIQAMAKPYPELADAREYVQTLVRNEEERFRETLEQGTARLDEFARDLRAKDCDTLPGEQAFLLYDSFGFPVEMTAAILEENGLKVDLAGFDRLLGETRQKSRALAGFGDVFETGPIGVLREQFPPTEFVGHDATEARVRVLAILRGGQIVLEAPPGGEVMVLCDRTPFYGESGGQVGDTGRLTAPGLKADVLDTVRPFGYFLHRAAVREGALRTGQEVLAAVDGARRLDIMRHHTGTHVLQAALRKVLGPSVRQTGSIVLADRLRFDFTHPRPLSPSEIRAVEDLANRWILEDHPVTKRVLPIDEARREGALMFFGEKYGQRVRVIAVGGFSRELCGGTHLDRSATIGLFKIVSESSIGAGMRRIEALTGPKAVEYAMESEDLLREVGAAVGSGPRKELPRRVRALLDEARQLRQQVSRLQKESAGRTIDELVARAQTIGGERILAHHYDDGRPVEELRSQLDVLLKKGAVGCALLGSDQDGRPAFVIGVRKDLVARGVKAGDLAKAVGQATGAGGGGKDHMAQAGGPDRGAVAVAHEAFRKRLYETLAPGGPAR